MFSSLSCSLIPNSKQFSFQWLLLHVQVFNGCSSSLSITRRNKVIQHLATSTSSISTKHDELITSTRIRLATSDQILIDRMRIDNEFGLEEDHHAEPLDEADKVMQRMDSIIGRMRITEMKKLANKLKGDVSVEEIQQLVETMSREIVGKFLEKPIRYLRYGEGKLEDRLKDFKLLLGMLECSILKEEKNTQTHHGCLRNSSS